MRTLAEWGRTEVKSAETATAFFRRVDLARVKATIADLEQVLPGEAEAADFVDLGEQSTFEVTTMDGECSA